MTAKSRSTEEVDRNTVADKIEEIFARTKPLPEDVGRSEEDIMEDVIEDMPKCERSTVIAGSESRL